VAYLKDADDLFSLFLREKRFLDGGGGRDNPHLLKGMACLQASLRCDFEVGSQDVYSDNDIRVTSPVLSASQKSSVPPASSRALYLVSRS
jgi:hypothetical protein